MASTCTPSRRRQPTVHLCAAGLALLLLAAVAGCGTKKPQAASTSALSGELILFHAGSLAVPLREITKLYREKHPGVTVKAEAAGSRDTARKVSDLARPCDVLAAADYQVVEELLMPQHAEFNIRFATNELALAATEKSKLADKVNAENWPEILLRSDVAFGRADPNRDPCGYRTAMLFQLAERHSMQPGLAEKLLAKDHRYIRPKETDLLALLESGEIDYLFIYRSVIQQHGLKLIALPDEVNLKSPALAELYRTATVQVTGRNPGETATQTGEPIVYSVTIPLNASNRPAAEAYVGLLLSPEGQAVMAANGQSPLNPALVDHPDKLPPVLKPLCRSDK